MPCYGPAEGEGRGAGQIVPLYRHAVDAPALRAAAMGRVLGGIVRRSAYAVRRDVREAADAIDRRRSAG